MALKLVSVIKEGGESWHILCTFDTNDNVFGITLGLFKVILNL